MSRDLGAWLTSEEGRRDPHLVYAALRTETDGLYWSEHARLWLAAHHRDVVALLGEPKLGARSKRARLPPDRRATFAEVEAFFESWVAFSNPPEHDRRREGLQGELTSAAAERLRAPLRAIAAELVHGLPAGRFDLLSTFVRPYTRRGIGRVLGIPDASIEEAGAISDDLMAYLGGAGWDLGVAERARDAIARLDRLVRRTFSDPESGGTAARLRALAARGDLGWDEILGAFAQILTGGIEPVAASLVVALEHTLPRSRPSTRTTSHDLAAIVREALRWGTPFHFAPRCALEDFSYRGSAIRRGDTVGLVLASANRDEAVFERADEFVVGPRARSGAVLSLSRGRHACVGGGIAKVAIATALDALLGLGDHLVLAGPPVPGDAFGMTSFATLPVSLARPVSREVTCPLE